MPRLLLGYARRICYGCCIPVDQRSPKQEFVWCRTPFGKKFGKKSSSLQIYQTENCNLQPHRTLPGTAVRTRTVDSYRRLVHFMYAKTQGSKRATAAKCGLAASTYLVCSYSSHCKSTDDAYV